MVSTVSFWFGKSFLVTNHIHRAEYVFSINSRTVWYCLLDDLLQGHSLLSLLCLFTSFLWLLFSSLALFFGISLSCLCGKLSLFCLFSSFFTYFKLVIDDLLNLDRISNDTILSKICSCTEWVLLLNSTASRSLVLSRSSIKRV